MARATHGRLAAAGLMSRSGGEPLAWQRHGLALDPVAVPESEVEDRPQRRVGRGAGIAVERRPHRVGVEVALDPLPVEEPAEHLTQPAAHPAPYRGAEALLAAIQDPVGHGVGYGRAQYALADTALELVLEREAVGELDEPRVEERHAGLHAVRHREPVDAHQQQLGQAYVE